MKKHFSIVRNYAIMVSGTALAALAIDLFLAPNRLAGGGVSGIATVLHYVTGLPIGVLSLLFNLPLFLIGMRKEGKAFAAKSIVATLLFSGLIDLFSGLPPVTDDLLLSSVFGGVLMGLGLGLVFVSGATTGGTDIVAKLVQRVFRHFPMGQTLLLVDALVITFAIVVFRDIQVGLYAIVSLYVSTTMVDRLIDGGKAAKTVFIISDHNREIARLINTVLVRGVTGLSGEGMYSGVKKQVLMCTLKRNEIPRLKDLARGVDPNAFVILTDVREVLGEGFIKHEGGNNFEKQ